MRIQIVSDLGPPIVGGAETYVNSLCKELASRGNDVYWNYTRIPPSPYNGSVGNVSCRRAWVPFSGTNISFARLLYPLFMFPAVLKTAKNADIIQFNSFLSATTGWMAGKMARKPYLLMAHEFFRNLWGDVGRNLLERNIYPQIEKIIAKSPYPQIICPSEYTKRMLIDAGADERIINVIYHGIDHSIFHPNHRTSIKDRFRGKHVIGWTGRIGLSVSKNLNTLLEAYKIVKDQMQDSIMLFSGSNFDRLMPSMERIGLKLDEDVAYAGEIPKEKLPEFYSSCDVFAMPSLSEGFGFSALEAQACGTPVVSFEKGALPEIVKDGETGIIVKDATAGALAEGMIEILNDENLRKKLGSGGPHWAQNFTWEKSAVSHLEVYERCLEKL